MKILTFEIKPSANKTAEQFFKHTDKKLIFKGVLHKINGLILCIGDSDGRTTTEPLTNTQRPLNINISKLGFCWFEWKNTDKIYKIDVELQP